MESDSADVSPMVEEGRTLETTSSDGGEMRAVDDSLEEISGVASDAALGVGDFSTAGNVHGIAGETPDLSPAPSATPPLRSGAASQQSNGSSDMELRPLVSPTTQDLYPLCMDCRSSSRINHPFCVCVKYDERLA